MTAGDQAKTVAGDPQIEALAQGQNARQIEERGKRPEERQPPGEGADGVEAVQGGAAVGREDMHLIEELLRRDLEAAEGGMVLAHVNVIEGGEPVELLEQRDGLEAKGAGAVVEDEG